MLLLGQSGAVALVDGAAAGFIGFDTSAAGEASIAGSASAEWAVAGAAQGRVTPHGDTAGTFALDGQGTLLVASRAGANVVVPLDGSAGGRVTVVGGTGAVFSLGGWSLARADLVDTPAERVAHVPAQVRLCAVEGMDRTIAVGAAGDRVIVVPFEERLAA
jgi:hypothetical protein